MLSQMLDRLLGGIFDGRYDVDENLADTNPISALVGSAHKIDNISGKLDSFLVHKMACTGRVRMDESLQLHQSHSSCGLRRDGLTLLTTRPPKLCATKTSGRRSVFIQVVSSALRIEELLKANLGLLSLESEI